MYGSHTRRRTVKSFPVSYCRGHRGSEDWKAGELRELRRSAIDPVRTDAGQVERRHDPLRLAEVAPSETADFENREPLRKLREHLMRKIDLLQAFVELGHCSGLGPSGEKSI